MRLVSGKTEVDQVLAPIVTSTFTEPNPTRGPDSRTMTSACSSGTVTKCHAASPGATQTTPEK